MPEPSQHDERGARAAARDAEVVRVSAREPGAYAPGASEAAHAPSLEAQLWRDIGWYAAYGIVAVEAASRRIIACNPEYARQHGHGHPHDLVGTSVDELYAPEERDKLPKWLAIADATGAHRWESVHLRADGTRFPVAITLSPVREASGAVRYRVATTEDITRRREHEVERERLLAAERRARRRTQRLLDLTTALAGTTTVAGAAGVAVAAGMDALGAASCGIYLLREDGSMTLSASRGFPHGVAGEFSEITADAPVPSAVVARTGRPLTFASPAELAAAYPHLADVWEAMRTRALAVLPLTVAGRCIGAFGVAFEEPRDLSGDDTAFATAVAQQASQALERARLFEAERQARGAADAANQAKARFLATMSHELRTPINAAVGYVDVLEMGVHGPVTAEQVQALGRIRQSHQLLMKSIEEVLGFARVEAGRLEYHLEPVDVATLLAAVEPVVAPLVDGKRLRFACGPTPPGLVVRADRTRVQQVLLNLVSNAVKFTPADGEVTLSCVAEGRDGDGAMVGLRVRDTGVGIPAGMTERVFEPFVQVDATKHQPMGGTGLGLAISRELARGMGGDLTVESTMGAGSAFTLWLPRATAA